MVQVRAHSRAKCGDAVNGSERDDVLDFFFAFPFDRRLMNYDTIMGQFTRRMSPEVPISSREGANRRLARRYDQGVGEGGSTAEQQQHGARDGWIRE